VSTPATPGRPSVDDVARWIRTRTKDDQMREVGTFDDATRPTDVQVEGHIDDSLAIVGLELPALDNPALTGLLPAVATVVALGAACAIEKAYWPEQYRTDRSNYSVLKQEYDDALESLAEQAKAAAGGGTEYAAGWASVPIGSWTSIE
jgi:cob(I)alamin adenosyltransferase